MPGNVRVFSVNTDEEYADYLRNRSIPPELQLRTPHEIFRERSELIYLFWLEMNRLEHSLDPSLFLLIKPLRDGTRIIIDSSNSAFQLYNMFARPSTFNNNANNDNNPEQVCSNNRSFRPAML